MKLLTKEVVAKLRKAPIGTYDGKGKDAPLAVKFFNPCGAGTWLITEGEEQPDGDWLLYGYCCISDWEWGYITLSELENYRSPWGLGIERDRYAKGTVEDNVPKWQAA